MYYCDTEDQELIHNQNPESCMLDNINIKNQLNIYDLDTKADNTTPETKRKPFKIPDHISSIECNSQYILYSLYTI